MSHRCNPSFLYDVGVLHHPGCGCGCQPPYVQPQAPIQPGVSQDLVVTLNAEVEIGSIVGLYGTEIVRFNANNVDHQLLGIARSEGSDSSVISLCVAGTVVVVDWGLVTGRQYFAGLNGEVSANTEDLLVAWPVGVALNADTLLVRIGQRVVL